MMKADEICPQPHCGQNYSSLFIIKALRSINMSQRYIFKIIIRLNVLPSLLNQFLVKSHDEFIQSCVGCDFRTINSLSPLLGIQLSVHLNRPNNLPRDWQV
jgi:hypothetical protein